MSFEDQLRDALHQDSEHIAVVDAGTESVKKRAHRRRNRGRAGIAVLAAAGIVGSAVAVAQLRPEEKAQVAVQPAKTPESKPLPNLAWRSVSGTVSNHGQIATAEGVTYVLGTAPGVTDPNNPNPDKSLYRSTDGEHWSQTPLGANKWISNLSERDGVLYAVGTAPGTNETVGYRVATSSNDGASWALDDLPLDFAAPAASVPFSRSGNALTARDADVTVVAASATFQPLVQNVLHLGGDKSWNYTDDGVDIVDMSKCRNAEGKLTIKAVDAAGNPDAAKRLIEKECITPNVVEHKPWSDFAITDPAAMRASRILVSADGGNWKTVASPLPAEASLQGLYATDNGFVLSGTIVPTNVGGQMTTVLYTSPDGEQWSALPSLPAGVAILDGYRNTIVAGDWGQSANLLVSTDGGASWVTTDMTKIGGQSSYSFATAGPLGVAVAFPDFSGEPGKNTLAYTVDGSEWKTVNLGSVGAPKTGYVNTIRIGADHIEVGFAVNDTPGQHPAKLVTLLATPTAP